jgi:hypothetical protein
LVRVSLRNAFHNRLSRALQQRREVRK